MASGDTLCTFFANNNEPPDTDPATLDTRAGAANAQQLVLDFDPGTPDESAEFSGFMPRHYGGGGVTVLLMWAASTANNNVCRWDAAFKSYTDDVDDLDTKVFATEQSIDATAANNPGEIDYAEIAFTDGGQMDSVVAGEFFRLRITRDTTDAADTMSGDAELVAVEIRET